MPAAKALTDCNRRRRPAEGGYARGEETRSRIVAAALEVFGVHGFAGASTRMLAEKAGVTLPALQYYFDSKEGVYLACAEHIAEQLEARLGAVTDRIASALARERPSRARLLEMLVGFFDDFADLFLGGNDLEKWVLFIIREQAQPTKAFDIIFDRVMHRVLTTCAALVGALIDLPDSDEVRIRTFALIGQVVFFRTAQEAALRMTGWPDFHGERLQLVKDALRAQITAAFGARPKPRRRGRS
jgi:TetR/AcrR family transcriptional regulator, regulator of cefoperazone and chloramphenicol sensitivity